MYILCKSLPSHFKRLEKIMCAFIWHSATCVFFDKTYCDAKGQKYKLFLHNSLISTTLEIQVQALNLLMEILSFFAGIAAVYLHSISILLFILSYRDILFLYYIINIYRFIPIGGVNSSFLLSSLLSRFLVRFMRVLFRHSIFFLKGIYF